MTNADHDYDLIVIGAGPGGYTAAIRARQFGLKVAIVERDSVGGVCLNWGCIPSKNLIHQASVFQSMTEMEAIGVRVDRENLDYSSVFAKSRAVVASLTGGVDALLRKNNVRRISGVGRVTAVQEVTVNDTEIFTATHVLLSTGSRPMTMPGFEFDEERVLSSTGALSLTALPKSLIILGGGAIGCEFAYIMNCFGAQVTLVEMAEHLLPLEDFETCAVLERSFARQGIQIKTATRASSLKHTDTGIELCVETVASQPTTLTADKLLVVCGRVPNTQGIFDESLGIELTPSGHIPVGDFGQTSAPGVYAIGDITETPALAHVASKEAEIAVEHIAGRVPTTSSVDAQMVPSAIYCEPEVAGFGLREVKADGREYKKSVFNYPGAGKTIAVGKPEGMVKLICDPETDELLGAHVVGHNATELLHELLLAKHGELLPEDIADMIHAHPTISEASMEAARGINGQAIHA
ncbi:MAG: dihydrolipoyl dehydrogenase [Congregibacter sp.]